MGYLGDSESQVDAVPGLTKGEKVLRKLRKETSEGWKITSKNIAYTYFIYLLSAISSLVCGNGPLHFHSRGIRKMLLP